MQNTQFDGYKAPTVPVAEPDGLIKTESLTDKLEVIVPIWDQARAGDSCFLQINNSSIRPGITLSDPVPAETLAMFLPTTSLTNDGVHNLTYKTVNGENGVGQVFESETIKIDRTPPGAALLAPMLFSHINFGEILRGSIPGYADMATGDVIQTVCNGVPGPTYRIGEEDLTSRPVQLTFTRAYLEALDADLIRISYHVTDRAGNRSIESRPVELTCQRQSAVD